MMFKKESFQIIKNIQPTDWMKVSVYGILLAGVYYSTFAWLVTEDWQRDDYSYAFLIPLIALYLLWEKRECC
jgi:hypothetical protein